MDINAKPTMFAKVSGQADDEFVYQYEHIFTVKQKQGYKVTFQMEGDKPKEFTSVQPNGTFNAVFKRKKYNEIQGSYLDRNQLNQLRNNDPLTSGFTFWG